MPQTRPMSASGNSPTAGLSAVRAGARRCSPAGLQESAHTPPCSRACAVDTCPDQLSPRRHLPRWVLTHSVWGVRSKSALGGHGHPGGPCGTGRSQGLALRTRARAAAVTGPLMATGTMGHPLRDFLRHSVLCRVLNAGGSTSDPRCDPVTGHNTLFEDAGTDPGSTQAQTASSPGRRGVTMPSREQRNPATEKVDAYGFCFFPFKFFLILFF